MKTMYVYILECSDKSYYTGVTNNLEKRFFIHQTGENKNSYTYNRRPVKIVYCQLFNSSSQAIAFEKQVKGWSRKKKESIIAGNYELLPSLSINYSKKNKEPDK